MPPGIRWRRAISAAPSAPPVIAGDRVFLASLPGIVSVHDIKDGTELWREAITAQQPIVVAGEHVFVASGEAVQALRVADHAVAWRTTTGAITAPLAVREGWVIATSETRMLALRASDGTVVWQRDTSLQRERAVIDGNVLFVPLVNGRVQAVDLANGTVRWERPLGGSPAEPLVVGERLYVGASDKRFYCLNVSNGELDWPFFRVGAAIRTKPSTDGERVFFVGLDNLVRAHSLGSGSQRWQQGVPFRPFAGPAVAGGMVVIAGPVNDVRLLNAANGAEAGKVSFPEALVTAPAVGTLDGQLIVAAITGGLNESWKLWLGSPAPAKPAGASGSAPY